MVRTKLQEILTLIKRLAILGGLVVAVILIWRWCSGPKESDDFVIDDTPLRVEQIRKIIELNTVKFRDEVVVDTVEYYKSSGEKMAGIYEKLSDPNQIEHGLSGSNVKRRLTLIMKGELLYGVDLKKKKFSITSDDKQVLVKLPKPSLLTVSLTPEKTEVFVENGTWQDYERQALQRKAKAKMIASGERLRLAEKAKEPLERVLRQLIITDKPIVFRYE